MEFSYNATQAYEASLENFQIWLDKDKEYINAKIEDAILKGEFSIIYDNKKLTNYEYAKEIKRALNKLGYTIIEKIISEERKILIISWENTNSQNDSEEENG